MRTRPADHALADHRQTTLTLDASIARRHPQLGVEVYRTRFAAPGVGDAEAVVGLLAKRYKITPQLFGAVRWNRQTFDDVPEDVTRHSVAWGSDQWCFDLAAGYRFAPHTKLKLERDLEHGRQGWAAAPRRPPRNRCGGFESTCSVPPRALTARTAIESQRATAP